MINRSLLTHQSAVIPLGDAERAQVALHVTPDLDAELVLECHVSGVTHQGGLGCFQWQLVVIFICLDAVTVHFCNGFDTAITVDLRDVMKYK